MPVRWFTRSEVTKEMRLAQDLLVGGRKLAPAGAPPPTAEQLARFGILAVPIADRWSDGIEPEVLFSDPNRILSYQDPVSLAHALADDVLQAGRRALLPFPYPGYDGWPAVTAGLVAAALGFGMGLTLDQAEDAALGALLRMAGPEAAEAAGDDLKVRGILAQVFERPDGKGPRGLAADAVYPPAKAAGAGFAFARYIFEEGARPEEALEALWADVGTTVFPEAVRGLGALVLYPLGAEVLLSDGRPGLVVAHHPADVRRPRLRLADGETVDLADAWSLVIVARTR